MPIRLVITDDHLVVVNGLRSLLAVAPNIEVIGSYTSGEELLESLKKEEPDVILLDLQMPGISGVELVTTIKERYPDIRILMLTAEGTAIRAQHMIQQGCMGFILKRTTDQQSLIDAIERVYNGKIYLDASIKEELLDTVLKSEKRNTDLSFITAREKEVLQLVAEGLMSQEIAEKLSVGIRTIDTHRKNLLLKLKARNMAELIKTAMDLKLIAK